MCISTDADCVVSRKSLNFEGRQLAVFWPRSEFSGEVVDDSCKIKVTGLTGACDEDLLVMFFENKKRSGGGEVKKLEMMRSLGEALITFVDPQGRDIGIR